MINIYKCYIVSGSLYPLVFFFNKLFSWFCSNSSNRVADPVFRAGRASAASSECLRANSNGLRPNLEGLRPAWVGLGACGVAFRSAEGD